MATAISQWILVFLKKWDIIKIVRKLKINVEDLYKLYVTNEKTIRQIADELDCSTTTICDRFGEHGIVARTNKLDIPKDALYDSYVKEGKSSTQLAKEFNTTESAICRYLHDYGIPIRDRRIKISSADLERMYVKEAKSAYQIAEAFGCDSGVILRNLSKNGIPIRMSNNVRRVSVPKETLTRMYVGEGKTITDIGKEIGCDPGTVHRRLKEYDILRRTSGTRSSTIMSKEALYRMHVSERKSATQIAKELNCTEVTVLKRLRKYGIPVRGKWLRSILTKGVLARMYVTERKTAAQIAHEFACNPATIHVYLRRHGIQTWHDRLRPEREEKKQRRAEGRRKQLELKKFLGGRCGACHQQSIPLSIHHMWYKLVDVIDGNYGKNNRHQYYIDLEPFVKNEPSRFMLLCNGCHGMVGLMAEYSTDAVENLKLATCRMIELRKVHPTRYSELVSKVVTK